MTSENKISSEFVTDESGNPTGGTTTGTGLDIHWQNGKVEEGLRNGAFVEDVIQAAIARLNFFNESKFRCRENSLAITKLEEALHWLDHRTKARESQGVENTYDTHKE